ncbi:receptor-type tyrosine-protein phosphatase epsilon-like [Physella acuta]|uniref:receptor-type tyrosine-protein phosphatase epsilon-like n=1 Tax=Physella acuta TaxID=109671 RepID=UPI0027DE3E30|nr:receptor-type tyrosine-protein phosphatase epsilon-like [Physella acuta]
MNQTTNALKLTWDKPITICSLYISGGRNLAFYQPTAQSSTYQEKGIIFVAAMAVDGDIDGVFTHNSCSHTSESEKDGAPYWNITLSETYYINRCVLYNRWDPNAYRLRQFKLEMFDDKSKVIAEHQDRSNDDQPLYAVTTPTILVKSLKVTATYKTENNGIFVTLCEFEIYGDSNCDPGKFGLECEKTCNCATDEACFVATGGCPSGCKAGYYGEACEKACEPHTWGISCNQSCKDRCIDNTCNRFNGDCDKGCKDAHQPPACTEVCNATYYGTNCSQRCSPNCTNSLCQPESGHCLSCYAGSEGDFCDKPCQATYYGTNCSQRCSPNCTNSLCHPINGHCLSCQDGSEGDFCDQACHETYYGTNCSQKCSPNCTNSLCHPVNGHCLSCDAGSEGDFCDRPCENNTWGFNCSHPCNQYCQPSNITALCDAETGVCLHGCMGQMDGDVCTNKTVAVAQHDPTDGDVPVVAIVVPVVCGVVIGTLVVIIAVWYCRKKTPKDLGLDASSSDDILDRTSFASSKVLEQDSPGDRVYYNDVHELETSSTSIAVTDLNTFLISHDKVFFVEQFGNIPVQQNVTTDVAMKSENKPKNRYKNICAYDHSRVHLEINTDKKEGDYINASYIDGYQNKEKFIASQGPSSVILNDFIRMIWEQKVEKVVMLTNLVEEGKLKCERYWPEEGDCTFGDITVILLSTEGFADYTIRKLKFVKKTKPAQYVTHFHFTSWPDKGVPTTPWSLVDFKQKVSARNSNRPILVHCSAGVGRTGTFIALRNSIQQAVDTGKIDCFKTLKKLREDRILMIQTSEQYEFLHKALAAALMCLDKTISNKNTAGTIEKMNWNTITGQSRLSKEFKDLCTVVDVLQKNETTEEELEENYAQSIYQNNLDVAHDLKNRFPSIMPKIQHRAKLNCDNKDSSDYINAVLVPSFKQNTNQIITQLPMAETVVDFWRLVTQYKVSVIVTFELDYSDKSVGRYLPTVTTETLSSPPFEVGVISVKEEKDWNEKQLQMKTLSSSSQKAESLNATHLTLSDKSYHPEIMLQFINRVRNLNQPNDGTLLYMCKNGATFSGLACILTLLLDRMDHDGMVTVPLVVGAIKSIRPQVISTLDQYKTVYQILELYSKDLYDAELLNKNKTTEHEPDHSVYANSLPDKGNNKLVLDVL